MSKKALIVYYSSDAYDSAIDAELQRRGMREGDFRVIIAIPETMKDTNGFRQTTTRNRS